jgi:hypothetical protein
MSSTAGAGAEKKNSDIPFEQDMFRALITLLGAKEKAEYHRIRKSLELYLSYLKKLKTNSRHQILSMGLEFHSQNLKSQLGHIISRMRNNFHAMAEVCNEEDDKLTESYLELMSLSVFMKKPYLYDYDVDRRYSAFPPSLPPLPLLISLFSPSSPFFSPTLLSRVPHTHDDDDDDVDFFVDMKNCFTKNLQSTPLTIFIVPV